MEHDNPEKEHRAKQRGNGPQFELCNNRNARTDQSRAREINPEPVPWNPIRYQRGIMHCVKEMSNAESENRDTK